MDITLVNNADNLDFGLVGCRRSVPHLQRLSALWKMHPKIWNALSAFRIRSHTTTAAAPAARAAVGIAARVARRSPPLRHPAQPANSTTACRRTWMCTGPFSAARVRTRRGLPYRPTEGGDDDTKRDAGVAIGGGGRLGGGAAIWSLGFAATGGVARGADLVEQRLVAQSSR